MGLSNLRLPSAVIEIPGGDQITVRGLSTVELEDLVRKHRPAVEELFNKTIGADQEPNWSALVSDVLKLAPKLVGEFIAIAADEPEAIKQAMKLTPGLQIKLIDKIATLTFAMEDDGKNLIEIVAGFLENLNPLLGVASQKLTELEVHKKASQSTPGSGVSDAK